MAGPDAELDKSGLSSSEDIDRLKDQWAEAVSDRLEQLGAKLAQAYGLMGRGGEREHRLAAFIYALDGCIHFIQSFDEFRVARLDAPLRELQLNIKDVAVNGITPDDFDGRQAKGGTERARLMRLYCAVAMQVCMECGLSQTEAADRVNLRMRANRGVTSKRIKEWRDELSRGDTPDPLYSELYHKVTSHLRRAGDGKMNLAGADAAIKEISVWFKSVKLKGIRRR